jgi:hypothetical protein
MWFFPEDDPKQIETRWRHAVSDIKLYIKIFVHFVGYIL